jgi:hypothetical protein
MNTRLATCSLLLALCAGRAPAAAPPIRPSSLATRIADARAVLAAAVAAARRNARAARPRRADALTAYYVRQSAAAAGRLPGRASTERARAFLLAVGVLLDDSSLLRKNPVTGLLWRRLETNAERGRRLAVLGTPTVHGRHDLAQHFAVSAALTAVAGAPAAEAAGVLKELLDAEGGSGFSFADLAADLAGVAFAEDLLRSPQRLARVAKAFRVPDYAPSPRGLTEGLTRRQFERRYGSVTDKRFRTAVEALRRRVRTLPAYRGKGGGDRPPHPLTREKR